VVTTDGEVLVLERDSREPVGALPASGFTRVDAVGDGRHVFATTEEGFRLVDTGVETEAHGDHDHHRVTGEPEYGPLFEASDPGHVTVGEATAAEGRAVVGCENGVVVVDHGTITKVSSPDA
jgi:hypothetical protein